MKKSVSPLLQGFIWGGCFTLTAAVSGFVGMTVALKSPLPVNIEPFTEKLQALKRFGLSALFTSPLEQSTNILVMGIDRVPNAEGIDKFTGRSDTMLLVRLEPETHTLKMLSIPRDSRVRLPNGAYTKINGANARGGVPLVKEVIQDNLNGVTVDHYIRVTTDAFKKLVDLVGGVEVYVPVDMQYIDRTQGLYIDLKQGKQVLNGEEAEQFARFRQDNLGDIGRVQRQQILLKALGDKMRSPQMIFKTPQIIDLLQEEIDTDLTSSQIMTLAGFALGLDKKDIRMLMLPGRPSYPREYQLSYWLISEENKQSVIEEYLQIENATPYNRPSPSRIRIAIKNATPNRQLDDKLAELLGENGYRNVYISQKSTIPTTTTQIIVQKGDNESAQQIQRVLNFGELEYSSTGDIDSDITIILGTDAEKLLEENSFIN
ncbi:LCP family protein [Cyanobacterium aponinum AL20118]|uniref:LytR family transcriptional regulator n=2 Tax=Cyanobacterium aponinum TaxID=379064 RepID=A0A844GXE6_9CHRO|nr:LCP family protein [Cyanobacterium aponinum]MBD2393695.1 LCP family protein [Cyanobacterium aponinum FACHB-4101]MTF39732.1 LytR family transcriptional regulator [Cyanobacterium aponinum 0216]PHV61975.1 transcriptional regulator [Cyanobacterium aponinum IPPAS B-1201]WPF89607.1 LCP family protein [Cyanobacterium aponinum AL20115]WRL38213.1 LCP family protein [Cyanobacterium aponinum UTEX 3221]